MIDILTMIVAASIREFSDCRGGGRRPPVGGGEV